MPLFEQTVWTDRQVQFPGRRKLTNVDTQEEKTVLVERNEGIVYNEGNLFDAANINDLEERVSAAFEEVEELLANRINLYYPVGKVYMSFDNTNPSEIFPGTTWEQLTDRVLLPVDPSRPSGETGGSNKLNITPTGSISVTSATVGVHYTTEAEMPPHVHSGVDAYFNADSISVGGSGYNRVWNRVAQAGSTVTGGPIGGPGPYGHTHSVSNAKAAFTGIQTKDVNNMQKGITVYAWRRLA